MTKKEQREAANKLPKDIPLDIRLDMAADGVKRVVDSSDLLTKKCKTRSLPKGT